MNIKEIITEVWGEDSGKPWSGAAMQHLERFAELILEQERKEAAEHYLKLIRDCVAAERERCAALIEEVGKQTAAAIRSRGDKHE